MFDGFWSGIFGGLLGPALAHWMNRFKYWLIFLFTASVCLILLFSLSIYSRGWNDTLRFFFADTQSILLVIFLPSGFGLSAVFVAFFSSLNNRHKPGSPTDDGLKE